MTTMTTTMMTTTTPPNQQQNERVFVPAPEFVRIWQLSASAAEAAQKMKMPESSVITRVQQYRAKGINLKKMPRKENRKILNVAELNLLIESLEKE